MYSKEKQSFGLIRTNAALTGNVKLTVSSDYSLSLNSIDGHPSLADIKFKGFKTDESSSYHRDVNRLFGKLSPNVIFNVDTTQRTVTSQDYSNQYDFRYTAGAKRCTSSYYKEQFSFFAPLQIGKDLPNTFVIYRLNGPGELNEIKTFDEASALTSLPYTKDLAKMLKNAKLVTSFDLTTKSTLGRYLNKTTSVKGYEPQSFVFRKDEDIDRYFLDWTGISVSHGVVATLSEDVTSTFKNHASLIEFEQYVTEGRTRLGLADHRTINIEFMFDDVNATAYTVNRYVGFYANAPSTGTVSLDGALAFKFRNSDGNLPKLKRDQGGAYSADGDFYQQNKDGVKIYIKKETGKIPTSGNSWIKGKYNDYYGVKEGDLSQLVFDNIKINLGNFRGTSDKQLSVAATRAAASAHSFFQIKLTGKPSDFDRIFIEHPAGNKSCKEGEIDPILFDCDYYLNIQSSHLWINLGGIWSDYGQFDGRLPRNGFVVEPNDFSDTRPDTWLPGTSYFTYFNTSGSSSNVLNSIASAINSIEKDFVKAIIVNDIIIVYIVTKGEYNTRRIFSTFDFGYGKMRVFNFIGGSKTAIRYSTSEDLANQANELSYISHQGVDRVKSIVLDLDNTLANNNLLKYIIELESEPISATAHKLILYKTLEPEVGDFKFAEWREFDGDFLDTTYAANEIKLLRSYFDMPDGLPVLEIGKRYVVGGSGSIQQTNNTFKAGTSFAALAVSFTILNGFPIVYEENLVEEELRTTKGVSSLVTSPSMQEMIDAGTSGQSSSKIKIKNPEQRLEVFNARDRFTRFIASNEYDALKENMTTNHSLESRTLPWISKWVHLFGNDTRDNPYRFNMSNAFGTDNLSPSFYSKLVSAEELTHEWFYIEGLGRTNEENAWHIDGYFDVNRYSKNGLDEFANFFKNRYVVFENSSQGATCIFKGVQYNMPARVVGYKFSIILKRSDPTPGLPPLSFKFYENSTYKNVVLVIEVSLIDYRLSNNVIDHIMMYSARSSKVDKNTFNDNYLSSSLDFSNASAHTNNLIVPVIDKFHSDLRNEIVDLSSVTKLTAEYPYGYYEIISPIAVTGSSILFPPNTVLMATAYDLQSPLEPIVLPFMTKGFWKDNVVKVVGGGKGLFKRTMERLSFGYFNQFLKDNPDEIVSSLIDDTGINTSKLELRTSLPIIVTKLNNAFYAEDLEKPANLMNVGKIGYTIQNRDAVVNLSRYSGPYMTKTRPCISFDDNGLIDPASGIILNLHGVKVGPTNILTDLGETNAYRLVDEFPLFNANFDVFSSSWSKDFYKKFSGPRNFVPVVGTEILSEIENLFGNILMNLPNQIYIENFTTDEYVVDGDGTITVIDIQDCVVQQITEQAPDVFVLIAGPYHKELIKSYVENNVMNLYRLLSFDIYVKPKKLLPYEFVSLSDSEKIKQGFTKTSAANVEQEQGYAYSINVNDNLNGSHQYTASILLELI